MIKYFFIRNEYTIERAKAGNSLQARYRDLL